MKKAVYLILAAALIMTFSGCRNGIIDNPMNDTTPAVTHGVTNSPEITLMPTPNVTDDTATTKPTDEGGVVSPAASPKSTDEGSKVTG